jgi:hypothetical protein
MLDVHPPHTSTHSWKDFWIHLGTITAGLLIAIGLEQSIEALHRHQERQQLEEELHLEAVQNNVVLHHNVDVLEGLGHFYSAMRDRTLPLDRGTPVAQLPPLPQPVSSDTFLSSAGTWTSARDSNQLSLLPRELASMYEELYAQRDFAINHFDMQLLDAQDDYDHFTENHSIDGHFDPATLSAPERAAYELLLDRVTSRTKTVTGTTYFYISENEAVVHGARSADELHQAVMRDSQSK